MRFGSPTAFVLPLALLAGLLAVGCVGAGTDVTAPGVDGEPLTNPNPGGDVDGSFIPYIPPADDGGSDAPIPTVPDPGLSVQDGKTGNPDAGGPWIDNGSGDGPIILFDGGAPAGGSVIITITGDGGSRTEILDSTSGDEVTPGLGDNGPTINDLGQVVVPLIPVVGGGSVYMSFTVLDGAGNPTGTSHGITLPPGWTLEDPGQSNEGQMF